MTIPTAAQVDSLLQPGQRIPFVDKNGLLTNNGWQVLQGLYGFCNGTNRIIPCNASGTNAITLTMLDTSPIIPGYRDYDTFRMVAAGTSTATVTALVVTPQGSLATLLVYKNNGSTQAGAGDILLGRLYDFVYVDSLNSGAGAFVLK